jgi:hypothetical protein
MINNKSRWMKSMKITFNINYWLEITLILLFELVKKLGLATFSHFNPQIAKYIF